MASGARRGYPRLTPSAWEVQRERCRLDTNGPTPCPGDPVRLSSLLPEILRKTGVPDDDWLLALQSEWPALVGADVAAHARPLRAERGVLTVGVDHSIWLDQLARYGRRAMLKNLQQRFGASRVVDIRLQVDVPGSP